MLFIVGERFNLVNSEERDLTEIYGRTVRSTHLTMIPAVIDVTSLNHVANKKGIYKAL